MTNRSAYHKSVSKPVTIRETTYSSAWHAAKVLGCTPQNVRTAAKEGYLDSVGYKKKTMTKPHTPDSLAQRWGCSAETVRQLFKKGHLRGFRVGNMIRIPQQAVEDYECQTSQSASSEEASASTGDTISIRHAPQKRRT